MVDDSCYAVLLGSSGMAELRFIRTHGSRFTPQDCTLFNWLARIITPVLQSWLNDEENSRWRCASGGDRVTIGMV